MQHIIEIRQKDITEAKLNALLRFATLYRTSHTPLTQSDVADNMDASDIPLSISKLMLMQWNAPHVNAHVQYDVVGSKPMQVHVIIDEARAPFIIVFVKSVVNPNTVDAVYIGYNAGLDSVNYMFSETKLKADEWRYCV